MAAGRVVRRVAAAAVSAFCLALAPHGALAQAADDADTPAADAGAAPAPDLRQPLSDPDLQTGFMLHSAESGNWDLRLAFPFSIGLTEFDLDTGIDLDNVSTVSVVPTLEFIVPVTDRWTFIPFAGAGGAVAVGERDAVSGQSTVGILTGGLRAQRWQPFAGRYVSAIAVEGRYDAALTSRDGLLGDWGSLTGAVEFRRSFGAPRDGPRLQAGIYAQGFWFWDPVELDIKGVTPSFLHTQKEFGISLGGSRPYEIWGIALPRVFLGVRVGEGVRTVRLRFGRL
jgi:hypothetical protein